MIPSQASSFVVVQCIPSFVVLQCNVTSAVVSLNSVPICCVLYDALGLVSVSNEVFLADLPI